MYGQGLRGVAIGIILNGDKPKFYQDTLNDLLQDTRFKDTRFIKLLKEYKFMLIHTTNTAN